MNSPESEPLTGVMQELRSVVEDFRNLPSSLPPDALEAYHVVSAAIHQLGVAIRRAEAADIDAVAIRGVLQPAIALHSQSPLINRFHTWPRGYPGDFETIEYLCDAENRAEVGTLAYYIEQVALHSAVTQQHRNKVAWQASEILGANLAGSNEKRILSIACGGSRDLRSIKSLLAETNIRVFLNDMDADALALSTSSLEVLGDRLTVLSGDVLRSTRSFAREGPFDVIVAGGLFDYLEDRRLTWLIPKLHACLRTHGALCFTNLAKGNPARAWMEHLCNWRIIERSEKDVLDLLEASALDDYRVSFDRDTTGLALLVVIRKTPGFRGEQQHAAAHSPTHGESAPPLTSGALPHAAIAVSREQRDELRRFREQTLIREASHLQPACSQEQLMGGFPWNDTDEFIYVSELGAVTGMMQRMSASRSEILPELRSALQLDRFVAEFGPDSLTVSSRPLLTAGSQRERAAASLLRFHYKTLRAQGSQFDFVCVSPALIYHFEQLGYRRYGPNYLEPTLGLTVPMVLVVEDLAHLHQVRSPLLPDTPSYPVRADTADWFAAAFPEQSRFVNRRTLESGAFWEAWGTAIRVAPAGHPQLFSGLTDSEVQLFLHESSVHRFVGGETIVRAGDVGDDLFVVLSGVAEAVVVENGRHYLYRGLQQGEVFGEIAMLLGTRRSAYVRAITDAEVLVISKKQLKDALTTMPRVASQVLLNLLRSLCFRLVDDRRAAEASAILELAH